MVNSVADSGHLYARRYASSTLTPAMTHAEIYGGMTQVDFMNKLANTEDLSDVVSKLKASIDSSSAIYFLAQHSFLHSLSTAHCQLGSQTIFTASGCYLRWHSCKQKWTSFNEVFVKSSQGLCVSSSRTCKTRFRHVHEPPAIWHILTHCDAFFFSF